jgi:hypothetical protein
MGVPDIARTPVPPLENATINEAKKRNLDELYGRAVPLE